MKSQKIANRKRARKERGRRKTQKQEDEKRLAEEQARKQQEEQKHSKLKHNQLMVILIVHTTKIVLQLEQLGKLLYIKGNQVIALILIVMAMELHVKIVIKKLLLSFFY